jgi:hypothetical protein
MYALSFPLPTAYGWVLGGRSAGLWRMGIQAAAAASWGALDDTLSFFPRGCCAVFSSLPAADNVLSEAFVTLVVVGALGGSGRRR